MQQKYNGMSDVECVTNIDNIGMVWKIHLSTLKWDIKRSNLRIYDRVMCNFPREVKLTMGPSLCSDNRFCLDVQVLQCGWTVDDYTPSPSTCPPSRSIHRRHRLSMSPIALLTSHRSPNNSWSLPQVVSLSCYSVRQFIHTEAIRLPLSQCLKLKTWSHGKFDLSREITQNSVKNYQIWTFDVSF